MTRALTIWLAIAGSALAQEVDQAQVDLAIDQGVKALKRRNNDHLRVFQIGGRPMQFAELVAFTYLHGGVPESDPDLKKLVDDMLERELLSTYCVSLQAMVLEELDRVKHQKRILKCAKFLVDNQSAVGQWGYGLPTAYLEDETPLKRKDVASVGAKRPLAIPPPGVRTKPPVASRIRVKKERDGQGGDNSNTQYAALGLRACHDAGIVLEEKVVELALKWLRDTQKNEKAPLEELVEGGLGTRRQTVVKRQAAPQGWCYGDHDNHKPYGSMTAGAIGSLAIWDYIRDNDEGKRKSWKNDPDVHEGLVWLTKNYSVTYNPGAHEKVPGFEENTPHGYFYYMYALERAGLLYGTEVLGKHKWYPEGAKELIASQRPDGTWGADASDTCFAILFLKRATRSLDIATHGAADKGK
ncbi:MAG TPA: hypothetical protein VF950_29595 [Planctomycetota bacterium]